MPHLEIETKLVVCSAEPDAVTDRVAALRRVAGFLVEPAPDLVIRDQYLDRRDELATLGVGMRIRHVGDRLLVTVKGPATSTAQGDVTRAEFEEEWSGPALIGLRAALAGYGVSIDVGPGFEGMAPEVALGRMGFEVDHDRETWRRRRYLIDADAATTLAELAVDRVVFRFDKLTVSHCEVEIEAKDPAGLAAMRDAARELDTAFADELRVWRLSKRGLGKVLEGLHAAGLLSPLVGAGGSLLPEAYGAIEQWVRSHRW